MQSWSTASRLKTWTEWVCRPAVFTLFCLYLLTWNWTWWRSETSETVLLCSWWSSTRGGRTSCCRTPPAAHCCITPWRPAAKRSSSTSSTTVREFKKAQTHTAHAGSVEVFMTGFHSLDTFKCVNLHLKVRRGDPKTSRQDINIYRKAGQRWEFIHRGHQGQDKRWRRCG